MVRYSFTVCMTSFIGRFLDCSRKISGHTATNPEPFYRNKKNEVRLARRSFRTFTKENEGNEGPFMKYVTRFVFLVIFCSRF